MANKIVLEVPQNNEDSIQDLNKILKENNIDEKTASSAHDVLMKGYNTYFNCDANNPQKKIYTIDEQFNRWVINIYYWNELEAANDETIDKFHLTIGIMIRFQRECLLNKIDGTVGEKIRKKLVKIASMSSETLEDDQK
jgi:hypothetical protein